MSRARIDDRAPIGGDHHVRHARDGQAVSTAAQNAAPRRSPASTENLAALRAGVLRLRQGPKPKNFLGLVKFIFPNDADVYLHDTADQTLYFAEDTYGHDTKLVRALARRPVLAAR